MSDDVKRRPASPAGWKAAASRQERRGQRYGWKLQTDAPVGQWSRRNRQVFIVLGAIACVAVIVVLIKLLQRPHRAGLALVGADPAADFDRLDVPLDPYGWQGGHRLAEWAKRIAETEQSRWGKLTPDVIGGDVASYKADGFAKWAEQLADLKADPLIVYFGLLGGGHDWAVPDRGRRHTARPETGALRRLPESSSETGKSYCSLIRPETSPSRSLGGCTTIAFGRSKRSTRLCKWPCPSSSLFAGAPGPTVLGFGGMASEAFTQAFLDGLRGAAAPGRTEVTAWDLFDYANVQTAKWTGANRPTRQTPIMLPKPDSGGHDRCNQNSNRRQEWGCAAERIRRRRPGRPSRRAMN